MKNTCCHYDRNKKECKVLCEMQCEERGKCSFCETEIEYNERVKTYNNFIQPQIDKFNEIARKNYWGEAKRRKEYHEFMRMSQARKALYIQELDK